MKSYPFKFLDPYTKEDKVFFFGRDEEINYLYEIVIQTNIVFVYGPSGSGKTSLIQCGLASRFQDTDWFELFIRKGDNISESTTDAMLKSTITYDDEDDDFWDDEDEDGAFGTSTVASKLSVNQQMLVDLYNSVHKPIYFIYDQFEEIYTLGNDEEQCHFIELIRELEEVNVPCTFLFVMREEYLANLYDFEKAIPHLLRKKFRVEPMNFEKTKKVIFGVTNSDYSNISLKGSPAEKDEIASIIFDKIREGRRIIQLPYFQIFMDRMYEQVSNLKNRRDQSVAFSLQNVQSMENIEVLLENFLDQQIHNIENRIIENDFQKIPNNLVMRILSPLVTLEGTKEPINRKVLLTKTALVNIDDDLINLTLSLLESSRILRYRDEGDIYEVAHDTLAKKIAESRSVEEQSYLKARKIVTDGFSNYDETHRYLNAKELNFTAPYQSRLLDDITTEERNYVRKSRNIQRRKQTIIWGSVILFFVIGVLAFNYVLAQNNLISKESEKAKATLNDLNVEKINQLIGRVEEIQKSDNCPPQPMWDEIEHLYLNIKAFDASKAINKSNSNSLEAVEKLTNKLYQNCKKIKINIEQ